MNPVSRIVEECFDGKVSRLAASLGVTYQAVRKWEANWEHNGVPPKRALELEEVSDGRVTRHDLRPDLWPRTEVA